MIEKIVVYLESLDLLSCSSKYWWPESGTFAVVIGAVLTQNTTWNNVEKSLQNLQGYLRLEDFVKLEVSEVQKLIRPSGFYNQKSFRLVMLAKNIYKTFGNFENFQKSVNRQWLLEQKGIGEESADAILCYGCMRETMVVDLYTKRLLQQFGIKCNSYKEYQSYIIHGTDNCWGRIEKRYEDDRHLFYAKFHGMIVEYNKLKLFRYNKR